MAYHVLLFWTLLGGTLAYALACGGAPERWGASILFVACVATHLALAPMARRYVFLESGVAAVDVACLAALLLLALRATRYWPMWLAALQFLQVLSHLTWFMPHSLIMTYAILAQIWGYPMVIAIAIGTYRHGVRLRRHLDERPWV